MAALTRADRISRSQEERHRIRIESEGDTLPEKKRCSRADCDRAGQWLDASEFYVVQRELKSGRKKAYLKGECKRCSRKRKKDWIDKIGREEYLRRVKDWDAKRRERDPDAVRLYNRRWWRKTHGKGIRTWKIYAHEVEGYTGSDPDVIWLDPAPFVEYLDRIQLEVNLAEAEHILGLNKSFFTGLMNGKQKKVKLEDVDTFLLFVGQPLMLSVLYPLEEQ
jgi:hypothetical protein